MPPSCLDNTKYAKPQVSSEPQPLQQLSAEDPLFFRGSRSLTVGRVLAYRRDFGLTTFTNFEATLRPTPR